MNLFVMIILELLYKYILCILLLNGFIFIGLNLRGGDLFFLVLRDLFLIILEWIV